MRVLCTGDIHLGRPISQIPSSSHLAGLSSTAAWRAIVDLAIEEKVDLVAISGDLVDYANRYYEAIGPVEEGVRRLAAAGIAVVAVAGNHDYSALPRIADRLDGALHLIGRNQQWERWSLVRGGKTLLHVDGWSFRQEHVAGDPLAMYAPARADDAPVLGLLHADLDSQEARYAPVPLWRLQKLPVNAWLLGHIHVPRLIERDGSPPVLYPGSPYALDPGEPGVHGVWLATFAPGAPVRFERRAIARARYQPWRIDVSGAASAQHAVERIERGVEAALIDAKQAEDGSSLELLLLRVIVAGAISPLISLKTELAQMQQNYAFPHGGATVVIEKFIDATMTAVDLQSVAAGIDAPASIARLILSLQPGLERPAIVKEARTRAEAIARQQAFRGINDVSIPDDAALAVTIEHEAWQLLSTLLAQKSVAS
jgi:DNA repair exonuclease SbcCD nuclease subunit